MRFENMVKEKLLTRHPSYQAAKPALELEKKFKKGELVGEAEVNIALESIMDNKKMLDAAIEASTFGRRNRNVLQQQSDNMQKIYDKLKGDLDNRSIFEFRDGKYMAIGYDNK